MIRTAAAIACFLASTLALAADPGIDLEGIDYPYPVQRFEFSSQNQSLSMAYMDVAPTADANGKTVLLLHGKNFNGDYWGTTAKDLATAGFRVIVPDQIGFGKSTKPPTYQYSFHQLASNTAALLDHAGAKNVRVVGHSMGGMLATRVALMYPDRVERLVLVNPIGLEDWKLHLPYRPVEAWYQSELKATAESIRNYQLKSYYAGKWSKAYDRGVELSARSTTSKDYPRLAWNSALQYDMIWTQPVLYEFGQLKPSTLLIIGTRDRTAVGKDAASPEVAEKLGLYEELGKRTRDAIPNAKLVELEDVGHVPMLEAYDRYITPLEEFLQE
jgi:pimeloyl-ACP methyl ester carboxylesterase